MSMNYTSAFARYGAKLKNANFSVCAWSKDGDLVVSCWAHLFTKEFGALVYREKWTDWNNNNHGLAEYKLALQKAVLRDAKIRLVVATLTNPRDAEKDKAAQSMRGKAEFDIRDDLLGEVTDFDPYGYTITFSRSTK